MTKNQRSAGVRPSMRTKTVDPRLGREIRSRIGQQLRGLYDDVVKQGVPDRFVHLLERLDQNTDFHPTDRTDIIGEELRKRSENG